MIWAIFLQIAITQTPLSPSLDIDRVIRRVMTGFASEIATSPSASVSVRGSSALTSPERPAFPDLDVVLDATVAVFVNVVLAVLLFGLGLAFFRNVRTW